MNEKTIQTIYLYLLGTVHILRVVGYSNLYMVSDSSSTTGQQVNLQLETIWSV